LAIKSPTVQPLTCAKLSHIPHITQPCPTTNEHATVIASETVVASHEKGASKAAHPRSGATARAVHDESAAASATAATGRDHLSDEMSVMVVEVVEAEAVMIADEAAKTGGEEAIDPATATAHHREVLAPASHHRATHHPTQTAAQARFLPAPGPHTPAAPPCTTKKPARMWR
jgi:guanyl-specific ribonuclease Sa